MKYNIRQMFGKLAWPLALLINMLALSGCSTQHSRPAAPELELDSRWLLMPIVNYSQTPQAGERAESILETRMHAEKIYNLTRYPVDNKGNALDAFDDNQRLTRAMRWGRQEGADYLITGSVDEWRYKSGLDGEPAVGLSLKILKLPEETVLWSGSSARSGWPKESLAGTAQIVIDNLIDEIDW